MAAQATWARRSKCRKSRVSWTLAAEGTAPSGKPSVATTRWYLVPGLPRSVGLGPVSAPPRLARTEQLSTTTSQRAGSDPARTMRIRARCTWRKRAVPSHSPRRRRKVAPLARPAVARSSRHCTPSRTKNRSASTTLSVGNGGRPVPGGLPSSRSMTAATNAAAFGPMRASPCQAHGKPTAAQPGADEPNDFLKTASYDGQGSAIIDPGHTADCVDVKASYVVVRGFNIRDCKYNGILVENRNVTIENNTIEDWGIQ